MKVEKDSFHFKPSSCIHLVNMGIIYKIFMESHILAIE